MLDNTPMPHQYHRDTASVIELIDAAWDYLLASHPLAGVIKTAYQEELT